MAQKFESNGRMYDVEIFQHEDTDIVRFYEELEMTQDREIGSAILDSIVMGLIFILYPLMIMVLILEVVEMVNE